MTLKQKLAEKERLAAEAKARGDDDDLIDERTEQDRRREAREKELEADLAVAADLMGDMSVDTGAALKAVVAANPKTKDDFAELSRNIVAAITSRHAASGLYPAFVEQLAKDLCESLSAVQTRKVSSALSVLGNTKQQEERDKASGKKTKVSARAHVVIVARARAHCASARTSVLASGPQDVPSHVTQLLLFYFVKLTHRRPRTSPSSAPPRPSRTSTRRRTTTSLTMTTLCRRAPRAALGAQPFLLTT